MNASIILAHPRANSFNHVLSRMAVETLHSANVTIYFHDLYKENFNPVLSHEEFMRKACFDSSVTTFIDEVTESEIIIFIHPDWWGQPPAILKGWIDRVFQPGIAYEYRGDEFEKKTHHGLLGDKKILVLCTSNHSGTNEKPVVQTVWERAIFPFCGIGTGKCLLLSDVHNSSFEQRKKWIASGSNEIRNMCTQ